jgi:hypothetical protein
MADVDPGRSRSMTRPVSAGRQLTAAEGALAEPRGPAAGAVPQLTGDAADGEHRSHLGPEPGRPAHARRSARRCGTAVPQRRPQLVRRGRHPPAAPPGRRPRHPPSLPAVGANSFVFSGNPGYPHPAILTHRTMPGLASRPGMGGQPVVEGPPGALVAEIRPQAQHLHLMLAVGGRPARCEQFPVISQELAQFV